MIKFFKAIYILLFFLSAQNACAQSPTIKTFVDRDNILIGEHIKYKVVLTLPNQSTAANWFNVPDSFLHFELVEQSKLDTSVKDGNVIMQQTLTITSFDSGVYKTPFFKIDITDKGSNKTLFTDSIPIKIGYAAADSTNQLRDIKPIIEVDEPSKLWMLLVIIGASLLALIVLIYFLKKIFGEKGVAQKGNRLTAFDEAIQHLQKLKNYNFHDELAAKKYYSELSTLLKHYISRKERKALYSNTTNDVLLYCKSKNIKDVKLSSLASALRIGDAVKFAKYLPENSEHIQNWQTIKSTIEILEDKRI